MRHSLQKHNVARLRVLTGEKQEGFAKLIGCSVHTLQSIETGRLKLSEELARKISAATNVDLNWLRQNDLTAEPCVAKSTSSYTRSTFENAQAERQPDFFAATAPERLLGFYGQLRAIICDAAKRGQAGVVIWKLGRFTEELRQDYGHDEAVAPIAEFRLAENGDPGMKIREFQAGMRLAKEDIAKLERTAAELWSASKLKLSEPKRPMAKRAKLKRPTPKDRIT